ncbi:MAG: ubiquinol-cytochrome c reductase iron-sulfur subunit [Rhodospirillales bacterium]|jgi:ubiquinol-cytochrome c reductase iron-sulfur subunit
MSDVVSTAPGGHDDEEGATRRDFLVYTTVTVGSIGAGLSVWPLVDTMNPAKDVLALSSTDVDLSPIEMGQSITVVWRGKPVFVRHRLAAEIEQARSVAMDDLPDPQQDASRVKEPQWLVMVGVCTHLGCIPLGQKASDPQGDFGGWFCPCHGSHYDTSGRIRRGPAPENLPVPPYEFLDDNTIRIG